jgi:hypothetical protein
MPEDSDASDKNEDGEQAEQAEQAEHADHAEHGEKAKRGPTVPDVAESLLAVPRTLDFLQFPSMKNIMQTSRVVRDHLSSLVTVELSCIIAVADPDGWRYDLSSRLKMSKARHWRIRNFFVDNGNVPFDRQNMKRVLYNVMPILGWPNATVLIRIHDSSLASGASRSEFTGAGLGLVTHFLYKSVKSLPSSLFRLYHDWAEASQSENGFEETLCVVPGAAEAYTQMNATSLRNVNHLICDLTQVVACNVAMPLITRLKVYCHNFALEWVTKLAQTFPNAERVHLVTGRELPSLCEQTEFLAPRDFALSLRPPAREKEEGGSKFTSMVVASHLYVLPASWGTFFRNVQRLQMTELATYFEGVEYMMEIFSKELPHLRRLGTVGEFALPHLSLLHEDKYLEELVIAVDMEKLHVVFREFVKIQQSKRRCTVKRFGVHLLCMDGLVRVAGDIEQAVLCGWHCIGTTLIDASGFICFSITSIKQLETAILQYPWVFPQWFCLDAREYTTAKLCDGGTANKDAIPRLPRSTPLSLNLPYTEVTRPKPSGTLANNLDWLPDRQQAVSGDEPAVSAKKRQSVAKVGGDGKLTKHRTTVMSTASHASHATKAPAAPAATAPTDMLLFDAFKVLEKFYAVPGHN